jgi:hypothetical protein
MRRHTACFCGCWFSVTLVWATQLLREAGYLVEPPEAGEPEPVDVRPVGGGGLVDTVAKGTLNETELVELDQAAATPGADWPDRRFCVIRAAPTCPRSPPGCRRAQLHRLDRSGQGFPALFRRVKHEAEVAPKSVELRWRAR